MEIKNNTDDYNIFNIPSDIFDNDNIPNDINGLVEKYKVTRKDRDFKRLLDRVYPCLYKFISRMTPVKDDIEDVISITAENIFLSIDTFEPSKSKFQTWICTIAKNNALRYINEKRKFNNTYIKYYDDLFDSSIFNESTDEIKSYTIMDDPNIMRIDNVFVQKTKEDYFESIWDKCSKIILTEIPDKYGTVMAEKYFNGKKLKDICEEHSLNMSTTKTLLRRGILMTKRKLRRVSPVILNELKEMELI